MAKRRILWICNHVTLMDAEVPLLEELGFEVFIPKCFPNESEFVSCKRNFDYDKNLTIPAADLELLNSVDFYSQRCSAEVVEAINRNFDIAISTFYELPLRMLVANFSGLIFIRAFGLATEVSYYDVVKEEWGQQFMDAMQAIRHRLFFAAAYANMLKIESGIFRDNGLFLPLGLPESFGQSLRNCYTGAREQILFVCPKICSSALYNLIYKDFKRNFGDLPHVITGKTFGKVDDPNILGFLPREEFNKVFYESRVMYYHSVEPRHLHYHPLEAMVTNTPVIFRSQGMLGQLGGNVKFPGAADSIEEARRKIKRVLKNDKNFIRDIQDSQKELLEHFKPEVIKAEWIKSFMPVIETFDFENSTAKDNKKQPHVGLFLPLGYRGGTLHAFTSIAKMLYRLGYKVTAGIPVDYFNPGPLFYPEIKEELKKAFGDTIQLRVFSWRQIDNEQLELLDHIYKIPKGKIDLQMKYAIMDDQINYFCECDRWFFISDRFLEGALLPLRPYSIMVYDYLQRYMPFKMFSDKLELPMLHTVRHADNVFMTNEASISDAVNYAGIKHQDIALMPFEFSCHEMQEYDLSTHKVKKVEDDYILWACNSAYHKNHLNILKAYIAYCQKLKGTLKLLISGENSEMLNPQKLPKGTDSPFGHIAEFHKLYKKNRKLLKDRITFLGKIERTPFLDTLKQAKFLLLSSTIDNGAFGAVEAAWLKVPCVCCDYKHMRYMSEYFKIKPLYYDGAKYKSIAQALYTMDMSAADYRQEVVSHEYLESVAYENCAEQVRERLKEVWI